MLFYNLAIFSVVPDPDSTFKIRLKKGPVQPITVKTYARPFDVSLDGEFYITVCDMMAIGANAKPHGIIKVRSFSSQIYPVFSILLMEAVSP